MATNTAPKVFNNSAISHTAGTQLIATSTLASIETTVKADPGNSGNVAVGLSSAVTYHSADATDGYVLAAGQSLTIPALAVGDASTLYVYASAASQRVSVIVK